MIYGYLRVSSDKQDVASQKIGVEQKAKELNTEIDEWISDEGVSGATEYTKRNLGELINVVKEGDIIICSEISRIARSIFMLFRIIETLMNKNVIIYTVKDGINTLKKDDIMSKMAIFFFGIAAEIERDMIIKRTKEGLERRRRDGVIFGRPVGSKSAKKLDGKEEEIAAYVSAGLTNTQLARIYKVNRETMGRFCSDKGMKRESGKIPEKLERGESSRYKLGIMQNEIFACEKDYIISLINNGLTNKYITEKLKEKGYTVYASSFSRWVVQNKEIHDLMISKNKEFRAIRNRDCGSQKQYYKF